MIRVCSWCEDILGTEPPLDRPGTTYAVCPDCRTRRRHPKSTVGSAPDGYRAQRWPSHERNDRGLAVLIATETGKENKS